MIVENVSFYALLRRRRMFLQKEIFLCCSSKYIARVVFEEIQTIHRIDTTPTNERGGKKKLFIHVTKNNLLKMNKN